MIQLISIVYIIISLFFINVNDIENVKPHYRKINLIQMGAPPVQVYHAINKYALKYDIPYVIAYGVAKKETGYSGPLDLNYTYLQTSKTGAEGAMQFMPKTIRWLTGNNELTPKQIRRNVDMNIKQSMIYLRMLENKYGDMNLALGYYNTGYPTINTYAKDIMQTVY